MLYHTTTLPSGVVAHKWEVSLPRAIIILQHGFGEHSKRYLDSHSHLIHRLNVENFDVWSLDLRGHGISPGERSIVDVREAVQDHLHLRRGAAPCSLPIFLFGHSLGGLITAASSLEDQSNLAGVILSAPAFPSPFTSHWGQMPVHQLACLVPTRQIPLSKQPITGLCRDAEQLEMFKSDPLIFKGPISFSLADTALATAEKVWNAADRWRVPIMIIHGTSDKYTSCQQSERFFNILPADDKMYHKVQDGLHELLNDKEKQPVLSMIIDWLQVRSCKYQKKTPK